MTAEPLHRVSFSRKRPSREAILLARKSPGPQAFDLAIRRCEHAENTQSEIPQRVVLLRPNPADTTTDQLFVDHTPVPRDAFSYNEHDRILIWKGACGGGMLNLTHNGLGAMGIVGGSLSPVSVIGGVTASFLCDVALNCGAGYLSVGKTVTGFSWNPSSDEWKSAQWVKDRLRLSYTVTPGGPMDPPTFTFEFEDKQTGSIPWAPMQGGFSAALNLGEQNDQMVWKLEFKSMAPPSADLGNPSTGPDTVFPYWMEALEDASASTINAVLEIDGMHPKGKLIGLQGQRASALAAGYFRTAPNAAPFGVFQGQMMIDGKPVPSTRVHGNLLTWTDLDAAHQKSTGLPASGSMRFSSDGSRAEDVTGPMAASRLTAKETTDAIRAHPNVHPVIHKFLAANAALGDSNLQPAGLLVMDPYQKDEKGALQDVVQGAVTKDLGDIMNSFVPTALWTLLFPSTPQTTLSGTVAEVAASAVDGVADAAAWYGTLATAVLTSGLADGSDANCQFLNGPRAAKWLKTEVAASKVYHTHGQKLFHWHWQKQFPLIADYLGDQRNNGARAAEIDAEIARQTQDIDKNVTDDPSHPGLKDKLKAELHQAGEYAKSNQLYWAFLYYVYNTNSSILANIALQMQLSPGADGTALSRLFQKNISVLTALDPSNFFARQYVATLNTFLVTNVLPTMFGFPDDPEAFDLIKEYLQAFVNNGLKSDDDQIKDAAKNLASILGQQNFDRILHDSIDALRTLAGTIDDLMALPYVAKGFTNWFSNEFPTLSKYSDLFGSALIGGLTGLAVFNLINDFKSYGKLSPAERGQLVTNALQVGFQIVGAVLKRGVRVWAIWGVDGLTKAQRAAGIGRILFSGEAEALDEGLAKIGSTMARWIGDTEGSIGKVLAAESTELVLAADTAVVAEETGFMVTLFGKNLDSFIATRLGPLFILAGIGWSLYRLIEGEGGVALAGDVLSIVSGSLMLIAMCGQAIGEWAIAGMLSLAWLEAGGAMEAFLTSFLGGLVSCAGPLGILLALVGVGLMLYELFRQPPDPVEEFVRDYAKKAGLWVPARAASIDYAKPYADANHGNLLMIGFTLMPAPDQKLVCAGDGSISAKTASALHALPECVWQVSTDGAGTSEIFTLAQPDLNAPPVVLLLSLMQDGTVKFQPKDNSTSDKDPLRPTTQKWLATYAGNIQVTNKKKSLASLDFTLQPVVASQATGSVKWDGSALRNTSDGSKTTFTLAMSGMAPNYMAMHNLAFTAGSTPVQQQRFGVTFGVLPSTCQFALTGDALPAFLDFSKETGVLSANGKEAAPAGKTTSTVEAQNSLGAASAPFSIEVALSGAKVAFA